MIIISECKDTKIPENTHYPNYRKNEWFSLLWGQASRNQNRHTGFYAPIKANDEYIRFAFITGITKFSPHTIFVFEIKINKPAKEVLAQIDEKGYMVSFEADDRKLVKIGISFSTETRTIEDWEYRVLDKVPTPQTPKKAYTLEEKRKEHGNAYLPWEKVADDILINFYNEGKTIKEIAEIMERSKGAIQSRLKKLGIIY